MTFITVVQGFIANRSSTELALLNLLGMTYAYEPEVIARTVHWDRALTILAKQRNREFVWGWALPTQNVFSATHILITFKAFFPRDARGVNISIVAIGVVACGR